MNKRETIVASSAVCAGLIGAGSAIDHRRGRVPLATGGAVALAAAYVAGTYLPNFSLFGGVARTVISDGDRRVALTFDDGPDPRHTPAISSMLAERGHRATFFVLGRAVRAHPDIVRQVAADGHEIACHGDDHRLLAFASSRTILAQIGAWEEAVDAALARPGARLVRTPHGVRSPWFTTVARRRGYAVCGWDGRVFDTAEPGVERIVRRVVPLLRSAWHGRDANGGHSPGRARWTPWCGYDCRGCGWSERKRVSPADDG